MRNRKKHTTRRQKGPPLVPGGPGAGGSLFGPALLPVLSHPLPRRRHAPVGKKSLPERQSL